MKHLTVTVSSHVGSVHLDVDGQFGLDLFAFIEEGDVNSLDLCDLALDGIRNRVDDRFDLDSRKFHRGSFGECAFGCIDSNRDCIDDVMEVHFRIQDFHRFLHRQTSLGIDQRSGFRIDDIAGLRVDHGFFSRGREFLFGDFLDGLFLTLDQSFFAFAFDRFSDLSGRLFFDGLAFFQLIQNIRNQRRFCRFFGRSLFCGLFDFREFCRRLLAFSRLGGFFRGFLAFSRFGRLFRCFFSGFSFFCGSLGPVVIHDDLGSFCDQSLFLRDVDHFGRFLFLAFFALFRFFGNFCGLFAFFCFFCLFDSFGRLFALFCLFDGFSSFFRLGSLFGFFAFFRCFFGFCGLFGHVAFFRLFGSFFLRNRFLFRFGVCLYGFLLGSFGNYFLAGRRALDVFCDLRGNGLSLSFDHLFAGFDQVFRKDGIARCSHDGEHHHEYQDEGQYASPASGSIQLTHTAFLSINTKEIIYSFTI